jgi:tRNA A-37 threonylcarbamoyl transferase component Bud32
VSTHLFEQLQATLGTAYRLERELGGGGMSRVFLAHEVALGRKVVVKVLLPELAAGVSVDRFRREILFAAQLQHPHIVPLLSAGESEGLPYFTMPFIAGETLGMKLARTGALPVSEVVRILRDVASALAYAHENGIVHRDVKPGNVLLSGGVAVVTDFGVAKAVSASADAGATGLTSLGVALGTPAYMAPEQAAGEPQIDHRVDIYALGVVTYEMLAGRTPFWGRQTPAVLAAHVVEAPEPIERLRPAVPPMLATLVMQCLAKRPADRLQSAAEVVHVLDAISTPSGGTAPTTVVAARPPATPPRRSRPLVVSAAVAVALALATGGLLWLRNGHEPAAPVAAGKPASRVDSLRAPAPPSGAPAHVEQESPAPAPPAPALRVPAPRAAAPPRTARPDTRSSAAAPRPSAAPVGPPESIAGALPVPTAPVPRMHPLDTAPVSSQAPPSRMAPPPPEPQAPPAAAPPPDPRPEIRGVLAAYASAIESQSLDNIRRVYPGMTAAQQRGWEQFFQMVRDVKAQLSIASLDVANGTAEAQMTATYTYLNSSTRQTEQQATAFHITLRREAAGWRISQVR